MMFVLLCNCLLLPLLLRCCPCCRCVVVVVVVLFLRSCFVGLLCCWNVAFAIVDLIYGCVVV